MALDTPAMARLKTSNQMRNYSRIIVRTPNWVGDAVMALPFLSSLRLNAPESDITVLTRPFLVDFYSQVAGCNRVIALDESHGRHGLRSVWSNAMVLRRERHDLAFCLPPSFGAALMMRLAGIKRRVGHSSDRRGWLLTDTIPYLPNGKRPHRALGYLELLGLVFQNPRVDTELNYNCGNSAKSTVDLLFSNHGIGKTERILALAPGAAQPNKRWHTDRFAAVGRRWLEQQSARVVIVGGETDRVVAEAVSTCIASDRVVNLCGVGSLPVAGEIIRRASMFLGNDSGLSHLASAVGTPVVVISGPGDPSEVAPLGKGAVTVKKALYCSPCYSNSCFRTDHPLECQDLVSVEEVWDAVHSNRKPEIGAVTGA
jgi:heptosyltransferase-2